MPYRLLADLIVVVHLGFAAFVVLGGFLALRWRPIAYVHLPCAVWGALISFAGWICPLTPLEVRLRRAGGEAGYTGGFVEHYVLPLLYPEALTRSAQIAIGAFVILVNLVAYALLVRRKGDRHLFTRSRIRRSRR